MTKKLIVHENLGVTRVDEPVSIGIPFEKGQINGTESLCLYDKNGILLQMQAVVLNSWNDGSIKWAFIDFQANVDAYSETLYRLTLEKASNRKEGISISREQYSLVVNTGKAQFHIDTKTFAPFTKITENGKELIDGRSSRCILTINGKEIVPKVKELIVEHEGSLRSTVLIKGEFRIGRKTRMDYISRLNFFADKSLVEIDFTLRNPMAAYHPGGLWDLGDKGSQIFEELCLEFSLSSDQDRSIKYSLQKNEPFKTVSAQDLLIYQESSGGENWNSPNHKNRFGKVPLSIKGFQVHEGGDLIQDGERATPVVWTGSSETGLSVASAYFWQNFPKSIEIKNRYLKIGLFPKQFKDMHEMQGGEQKTEALYIDFSSHPSELMWVREPLIPHTEPEEYAQSGAIPNFCLNKESYNAAYQKLVDAAITGSNSFIEKREAIDEYGWRNFGEVYADHEAVYSKDRYFISHYNNQYDLVFGMFRQFVSTGNSSWYRLMKELASHVCDIDIYHTDDDRDEFNHGLLWHTDHYIDAATSTHRTFSKEHLKVKDSRFCGGGPGAEHCYTTGLMYNYLLNGDILSREATLEIADWVIKTFSPKRTILGFLYSLKNRVQIWRNILKGETVSTHKYPLSRATGNAITACLDAYELSGDRAYIEKAGDLICGCVHPEDHVEGRNLLDVERHWYYTVFLVAVGKYLDKKIEIEEIDEQYEYARASLLVYAKWMLENEYPYLDKPEILEFPNETWPAQDMRKSCIFYYASKHASGKLKEQFLEKARFFFETSIKDLEKFSTKKHTRPIALLLQNGWVGAFLDTKIDMSVPELPEDMQFDNDNMVLSRSDIVREIVDGVSAALKVTSLKQELKWIRSMLRAVLRK